MKLLTEAGHRPSDAVRERLGSSLRAASVDPEARRALESGRLEEDVESTGLNLLAGMVPSGGARAGATRPAAAPRAARVREAREVLKAARAEERRLRREAAEAEREAKRAQSAAETAAEQAGAAAAEAERASEAVKRAEDDLARLQR